MSDEWTRISIDAMRNEIEVLRFALYGDRHAPPNGGGVYGEIQRLKKGVNDLEESVKVSAAHRDSRINRLDRMLFIGLGLMASIIALNIIMIVNHIQIVSRLSGG